MAGRIAFISVTAFWVTMNVLLWRNEYGSQNKGVEVPLNLVWRKILTAPDASMLNFFQNGRRIGFCQLITGIGEEMAQLNDESLPPKSLTSGYKIRLNGSVSLGSFTNRLRFDCELKLTSSRVWRELNLKLSSRIATVEIHSLATNQTVHVKITSDESVIERDLAFTDLQNPNVLLRAFGENSGGGLFGELELPVVPQTTSLAQNVHWQASRERLKIGDEPVSVYRLETQLLQNQIVIYVSTLGEILCVDLPGGVTAQIDEWSSP